MTREGRILGGAALALATILWGAGVIGGATTIEALHDMQARFTYYLSPVHEEGNPQVAAGHLREALNYTQTVEEKLSENGAEDGFSWRIRQIFLTLGLARDELKQGAESLEYYAAGGNDVDEEAIVILLDDISYADIKLADIKERLEAERYQPNQISEKELRMREWRLADIVAEVAEAESNIAAIAEKCELMTAAASPTQPDEAPAAGERTEVGFEDGSAADVSGKAPGDTPVYTEDYVDEYAGYRYWEDGANYYGNGGDGSDYVDEYARYRYYE